MNKWTNMNEYGEMKLMKNEMINIYIGKIQSPVNIIQWSLFEKNAAYYHIG